MFGFGDTFEVLKDSSVKFLFNNEVISTMTLLVTPEACWPWAYL